MADQPWITVHEGFHLIATIEAIVTAGRRLEIAHRINQFTVVAELVVAGGGLALMPRWTTRPHPDVVLRPLEAVQAYRRIDVLHRPRTRRAPGGPSRARRIAERDAHTSRPTTS